MEKYVRVNPKYGEWIYEKEVDTENKEYYVYYFSGIDANGKEWKGMVFNYMAILEFIKMSDEDKEIMVQSGQV